MKMAIKNHDELPGYDIRLFDKYNETTVGYPFFKLVNIHTGGNAKVLLIGGPLYRD